MYGCSAKISREVYSPTSKLHMNAESIVKKIYSLISILPEDMYTTFVVFIVSVRYPCASKCPSRTEAKFEHASQASR